jgi:tRNA G10  N-methylase Trm11
MPLLTANTGTNADLFPHILSMYVPERSIVADVTYGKGVFWQRVDVSKYDLRPTDLMSGTDFRCLPYAAHSIDALVFDPPYMHGSHGSTTIKASINDRYHNDNDGHHSVVRLYAGGLLEAARVLRKKGMVIVKCQDEIESGRQRLSHMEIIHLLELFGFEVIDLFVLVQGTVPAMRESRQQHARKNHSYAIVARFRR